MVIHISARCDKPFQTISEIDKGWEEVLSEIVKRAKVELKMQICTHASEHACA